MVSSNDCWNFSSCFFWHFQEFLLYFTRIYNCITGSDGLRSLFHVAMTIRNSNTTVRVLYENNLSQ